MSMTDMKDKISLLGHTALMSQSGAFIVNQRVGLLRSKNKQLLNYPYLYILTNNDPFLSNLRNKANSGVQVNLSTQAIKESSLLIPSRFQLKNFNNIAEIIFEKVFFNEYNIEVLNKTKTSLLNKLIK
jgi:type I restriction enzyme S subunit